MEGLQVAPCFSRFEFNSSYIYFNILEGHYLENIFLNNFFLNPLWGPRPPLAYMWLCHYNQQNLCTIKSSNLCIENTEFLSPTEIAVCNLASIALPRYVKEKVGLSTFIYRSK
jgi:hypothetical protein